MEGDQGFDREALAKMIEEKFATGLAQFSKEQEDRAYKADQDRQAQEQMREQQETARVAAEKDAFGSMVNPYIQPAVQALGFENQATRDYVDFYMGNPDAAPRKSDVEAKFQELARIGKPLPRGDIYAWYVGQDKLKVDREEATKRAMAASTMDGGNGRTGTPTIVDPYSLPVTELEAALGNRLF